MRILHLDCGRAMGGGQWQALRLVEAQAQAGHDVTVLAPTGSPLLKLAAKRKLSAVPISLARLYFSEPDLMHAHDARSHTMAALAARVRLVVSRRVAFPIRRGKFSRWKYSRPDRYIAVSEFVKRMLVEYGVPGSSVTTVYDGVPAIEPAAATGCIVTPATKFGPIAAEAASLAGIQLETSDDLLRDLPGARLLLYLSACEGLGSGILMAMSAGVPVVASRVGGIPEAVEDGVNGLLTENTSQSAAAAIRRLLEDPALAAACVEKGRQLAKDKFSLASLLQNTIRVYREVLK